MSAIKYIRNKYQLTLRQLTQKIGTKSSYLTLAERGLIGFSIKKVARLAKKMKEDKDVLLIAQGYLPDYTKELRISNPEKINEALKAGII